MLRETLKRWHISVNVRRLVGLRFIEVCVDSSLFMYVACVNVGFGLVLCLRVVAPLMAVLDVVVSFAR